MNDVVSRMIAHLEQGRPLTALSIWQSFGVKDWSRAIFTIRARGYRLSQTTRVTQNKYTMAPQSTIEYRLRRDEA